MFINYLFSCGHVSVLRIKFNVIFFSDFVLAVFVYGLSQAHIEQRNNPQAFFIVIMFTILVCFATEIDNHEPDLVYMMRRALPKDDMLVERVAFDGVGAVLRWIGAYPDGTNLAKIVITVILENSILLISNHASEVKHATIGQIIPRLAVRLRFDVDNDGNRLSRVRLERIEDHVIKTGIAVWVIALVTQSLNSRRMILLPRDAFNIACGNHLRLDVGEFVHRRPKKMRKHHTVR